MVESPKRSHVVAVPQDKLCRGKVVLLREGQRQPPSGKCGAVHEEENSFIEVDCLAWVPPLSLHWGTTLPSPVLQGGFGTSHGCTVR